MRSGTREGEALAEPGWCEASSMCRLVRRPDQASFETDSNTKSHPWHPAAGPICRERGQSRRRDRSLEPPRLSYCAGRKVGQGPREGQVSPGARRWSRQAPRSTCRVGLALQFEAPADGQGPADTGRPPFPGQTTHRRPILSTPAFASLSDLPSSPRSAAAVLTCIPRIDRRRAARPL
jgi:hypothetical protein